MREEILRRRWDLEDCNVLRFYFLIVLEVIGSIYMDILAALSWSCPSTAIGDIKSDPAVIFLCVFMEVH